MDESIILRSVDIERDAQSIADMWNASDDQWPGSWNSGVPMAADLIKTWLHREGNRDLLVWDAEGRIAGYCCLQNQVKEEDVIYLSLLNVSPDFQGKSLARRAIVESINRTVAWGKKRLDLHTWSGNRKAVPLYKKCGFFWIPGPHVAMLNFIPAILQMPCLHSFFEKHDWYTAFQRELIQEEDREEWEGLRVFTYRFVAGDEQLTVWADREGRRIAAVDTSHFFAAALVDDVEPTRGQTTRMRWKIINKKDRTLDMNLTARGDGDLSLDFRAGRSIGPGETALLEHTLDIPETASIPDSEGPARRITTHIRLGEMDIELGTGVRPRAAVSFSVYPEHITTLPGTSQTVDVTLRSALSEEAPVELNFLPSEGLSVENTAETITLPAGGYAGFSLRLKATRPGVHTLSIAARCRTAQKTLALPSETWTLFALPPGGLLCAHTGGTIRIENETLRLLLSARKGEMTLIDRTTGTQMALQGGRPIPPQWPSEYHRADFALRLDREDDAVVASASFESKNHPGFVFRKTTRMNAGPIISIDHRFENNGFDPLTFRLYHFVWISDGEKETLTLPLADGLVHERIADFPGAHDRIFETEAKYRESWAAYTFPHATLGLFWPDNGDERAWGRNELGLITRETACPPGSRISFGTLRLYAGPGDWKTVRRLWGRFSGKQLESLEPELRPLRAFAAEIQPATPVLLVDPVAVSLRVQYALSRANRGRVRLTLPEGWHSDHDGFEFSEVNWQKPFAADFRLFSSAPPGAYTGHIVLEGMEENITRVFSLIRPGDGTPVATGRTERQGQAVFTIDNGRFEIDVTPDFCGAVSAIRDKNGVNHLASAFPAPEVFSWLYPWYGGIQPVIQSSTVMTPPGFIAREKFTVEPVAVTDSRGLTWTGARQRATLIHEEARGLILELDTLTLGGSPVVQQVWRFINESSSARRVKAGWNVSAQPDGERRHTTVFSGDYERKRSNRTFKAHAGHWAGVENPETGRCLALISSAQEVEMDDWGTDGGHLCWMPEHTVPAHGHAEKRAFIVIVNDREEARRFAALKDIYEE